MAVSPNVQAARIKLHELQRQRDRLDEHYAAVERRAAAAPTPLERLRVLFDGRRLEGLRRTVREFAGNEAGAAASDEEVRAVLTLLRRDATRTPELRRQAAQAADSPTQVHEYAGVLTILLANLAGWDWPEGG